MGCNICISNRENYIEHEFKYADNNLNIKKGDQNNENDPNDENKRNYNDINDKNTDKEKDKDFLSNQLIPVEKIEPKNENNFPKSILKQDKKENIKINTENKNNEKNGIGNNKNIEDKIIKIENLSNNPNNDENNITNKTKNNSNINYLNSNKVNNEKENCVYKNNISMSSFVSSSYDYCSRIIDLINQLRTNPKKYSDFILSNLRYINKRVKVVADDITGQNEEKIEIFFLKKVKVELYKGENAFIETAKYLQNLKPLNELKIKEEIKIDILPENEEQIKDDNLFIKKQLLEINKKYKISAFFKDNVKNPEIGLMLMIIGDYKNSKNKKRNAILNPDYKYIGVNYKFIGDKFVSYFTFSK